MIIVFQKMLPCIIHLGIHLLMHNIVAAGIVCTSNTQAKKGTNIFRKNVYGPHCM